MKMKLLFLTVGLLSHVVLGDLFSFSTQPSSVTVEKGNSFTLTCVADNGDNTVYQWYKEDTVPNTHMTTAYSGSDAATSSIEVSEASLSDSGFYQCKATSDDGLLYSETAQVTIHYFNTVSGSSKSVDINTDTLAVRYALACDLDDDVSYPDASITWYKDNEVVSDENAFVVQEDTILKVESLADLSASANSLVLFNIKSSAAGSYKCKATVDSNKISVTTQTVASYELVVSTEFGDVDYVSTTLYASGDAVTAGNSVTLCCGTIGYNSGAIPTYTWLATNGDASAVSSDNLSDNNRTMTLDSVTTSHSYTCKACLGDSCDSEIVTASVTPRTESIEFTTEPSEYYLYEDGVSEGALSITCKTSLGEGNWIKDGESVSFPIESPASSDSGYYQCYASNTDSWVMVSTQVKVTETMTLDLTVPEELDSDTSGIITCSVSGYPSPSVTIYKTTVNDEKEDIEECYDSPDTSTNCIRNSGNSYYITVDNQDLESTGTYTCQATQTYRTSAGADKVKLLDDSGELAVIQDVDVYSFDTESADLEFGEEVTFTCMVSGGRAPFKVEMKFDDTEVYVWSSNEDDDIAGEGLCTGDFDKTCKGMITSVNYDHEGELTCTAYNTAANSTVKTDSLSLDTTVTRAVFVEITGDTFPVLGADLTLTCNHHEKPFSFSEAVTWTKGGDSIVPDSSTGSSSAGSYLGTVVGVFNDVSSDDEDTYKCKSENVESAGVEVYVDEGVPPSNAKLNVPDGEVGQLMTLTCSAEGYPPPTITWQIYENEKVDNITNVSKEKYKTTSELLWTPSEAVEMTIKCTATNDDGSVYAESLMTILTAEEADAGGLEDSELAAIIAACIIAAIILIICIVFIIICVCQHRRSRQHDKTADGTIIEKGPSKFEQTCLASCIACCPCCFRSESSDIKLEEDTPEGKWSFPFPSLPQFFSFITTEEVETPPPKKSYFRRHKADVTKLSKREKIADTPESKRRFGSLRSLTRSSPDDKPGSRPGSKPGTPTAAKRSSFKRPSLKRSAQSLPRGETSGKGSRKGKDRHRRNSAEDTPLAMKISHFFHIDSPFIKFDEEKQEYERTLSRVSKS